MTERGEVETVIEAYDKCASILSAALEGLKGHSQSDASYTLGVLIDLMGDWYGTELQPVIDLMRNNEREDFNRSHAPDSETTRL